MQRKKIGRKRSFEKRDSFSADKLRHDIALIIFLFLGSLLDDDLGYAGRSGGGRCVKSLVFTQMVAFLCVIDKVAFKFDIRSEGVSADRIIKGGGGSIGKALVISAEQVISVEHAVGGDALFEDGSIKLHHVIEIVHAVGIAIGDELEIEHL